MMTAKSCHAEIQKRFTCCADQCLILMTIYANSGTLSNLHPYLRPAFYKYCVNILMLRKEKTSTSQHLDVQVSSLHQRPLLYLCTSTSLAPGVRGQTSGAKTQIAGATIPRDEATHTKKRATVTKLSCHTQGNPKSVFFAEHGGIFRLTLAQSPLGNIPAPI